MQGGAGKSHRVWLGRVECNKARCMGEIALGGAGLVV